MPPSYSDEEEYGGGSGDPESDYEPNISVKDGSDTEKQGSGERRGRRERGGGGVLDRRGVLDLMHGP